MKSLTMALWEGPIVNTTLQNVTLRQQAKRKNLPLAVRLHLWKKGHASEKSRQMPQRSIVAVACNRIDAPAKSADLVNSTYPCSCSRPRNGALQSTDDYATKNQTLLVRRTKLSSHVSSNCKNCITMPPKNTGYAVRNPIEQNLISRFMIKRELRRVKKLPRYESFRTDIFGPTI